MAVLPGIANTLPKKARRLIGYHCAPAVNFIEELDDGHVLS